MTAHSERAIWMRVVSLIAIGFGLMTIWEGGAVLFVDGAARQAAGHYVPFVLWFNFLAGFAYIVAGVGLWMRRRWPRGWRLSSRWRPHSCSSLSECMWLWVAPGSDARWSP